jgi:hypothetical protein
MTIWSILTFICDFFKLEQVAASFWKKHEAQAVSDSDDKLSDSYVLKRLRDKYGR